MNYRIRNICNCLETLKEALDTAGKLVPTAMTAYYGLKG